MRLQRTQPSLSIHSLLMQTLAWANGATYVGEVQDGLRHGQGTMRFSTSDAVYEGQWQQGTRHGQGKLVYNAAGTVYYEGGEQQICPVCLFVARCQRAGLLPVKPANSLCSRWYLIWQSQQVCLCACVLAFSGVGWGRGP